ncbi:MAG TPA: nicotinate-nicotinamide nucleotide adenylyltransferase [Candidatus Saccharimonadales bacterium]|nr:nicotinate-nicotinamide nucleotide adenylyltransferase [Candidatus Saccharimonadales bacterium]
MKRIGIYAGTFDPVHAGHITFALQSIKAAGLDEIYFLPERQPRNKQGVEHFGHRVAMLKLAIKPHPQFKILDLPDINFSVTRTLPRLAKRFPKSQLVFLFGSDILSDLHEWPEIDKLLKISELIIGLRADADRQKIHKIVEEWPIQPLALTMFSSFAPEISSGRVRQALSGHMAAEGLLRSVERYSDRNWLYVSLPR